MSFSPQTGLVYIPAKQEPSVYNLDNAFKPRNLGVNLGTNYWDTMDETHELGPEFEPDVQGHLLAWNPVTQKEVWRAPQPGSHNGGLLSTAGNLLFQGNADGEFVAYRATTGERLWEAPSQSGITAAPVTYAVDGEQYIAVVVGWGSSSALFKGPDLNPDSSKRNISRVLAFKLGARRDLPPPPVRVVPAEPPEEFGDEAMVAAGKRLYARNCFGCHGATAVSGGVLPDLRHSAFTRDRDAWNLVVREGILKDSGMVSFAENLDAEEAEAIRAYVIRRANEPVK
jgi:alcohol dehydrogenase (cytochrome c)/quinohemoprotein ethanol dehydrogenase